MKLPLTFSSLFTLLQLMVFTVLVTRSAQRTDNMNRESENVTHLLSFPKNFLFGAASSSYQTEGAWNEDGKGENIWDRLTHTHPELIHNRSNGDVTSNSYHKYKEDVLALEDIGFDVYRFSISWTRILPSGNITNVNEKGIQYYNKLIDELQNKGIQPMVTIYHWDLPQQIQDIGGWMNPSIVDYFTDYADLLFKRLGNKIKWWITINEPIQIVEGYEISNKAPNLHLDSPANYIVAHNILRAHGRVFRLYENKYRSSQQGKLSITITGYDSVPKTNSEKDIEAANRAMMFSYGWFAHPIYSQNGDYPDVMRKTIDENSKKEGRNSSRLPTFTQDEIKLIKGSFDFFAVNHYTTRLCSPGKSSIYETTYKKDLNVTREFDPSWPKSALPWQRVHPIGFQKLFVWIKNQYNNVPVFVTENGFGDSGEIDDVGRISYYRLYLEALLRAIKEDGCNVIGYTVWSLLDNFEWLDGYKYRFGLIHVNFSDPERERTPKLSTLFFKNLLKTRILPKMIDNY